MTDRHLGSAARSHRVDFRIATAPGLVAITECFDADGRLGASEYFFRLEDGGLGLIDELVTVENTIVAYHSGFVPRSPLTFQTDADGDVRTFVFNAASNRFKLRQPRR